MGHRMYPAKRKQRTTEYAKSTQLINILGVPKIQEILNRVGMYTASKEISEITGSFYSPYVIRTVRSKINKGENNNEESNF
jgi:hypothetical protein